MGQIGKLTSAHAVRIYELCAQYKNSNQGGREISLVELKRMLCMTDEYPAVDDFKRRVITPAIKQINEHTDLRVTVENVKTGRSVTGLYFHISEKTEKVAKPKKKKEEPLKITKEYIERNALPGETYAVAFQRIQLELNAAERENKEPRPPKRGKNNGLEKLCDALDSSD